MALTKADIAESLYEELGLNKREARELVELYFDVKMDFHGYRPGWHHRYLGSGLRRRQGLEEMQGLPQLQQS